MSRRGPLLAALVFVVLAILAVVLLVLPKLNEVSDAKDDLAAAEEQQESLEAELGALQEAQANAPEIKDELARLATLVPPTADLPGMIRMLADAADRSGIDFFEISAASPIADPAGSFSIIPTVVTVNGQFFPLDEFVFRMEQLPRAAKVMAFDVGQGPDFTDGGSDEPFELTISMTVEFYTTDSSAGPGSVPGPTEGAGLAPPTTSTPTPTPTDTVVSETASPATTASPGEGA